MDNNTNRNNPKNDRDNKNQKKNQIIGIVVALVAAFLFTTLSSYIVDSMTTKEISYNQFIALLENNNVESVVFNNNKIEITPKDNNGNIIKVKYWTTELNDPELIQELKEKYTQVKFKGEQQSSSSNFLLILLEWVLPFVMFYVLLTFIMKKAGGGAGGGMFGVGKSNAKVYVQSTEGIHFTDVAGEDEAKENLAEIVDYLHNPKKYTDVLGTSVKGRLNTLVHNVIINSVDRPVIQMSEEVHEAMQGLRVFMFENVYRNPVAKKEEGKAIHMITNLYEFYIKNPEFLPEQSQNMLKKGEELSQVVCDYIAGMTDTYAVKKFTEFFIPESCNRRKKSL